jgi:hypothetical protein
MYALTACLVMIGCTAVEPDAPDAVSAVSQGVTEVRVDAQSFTGLVSRVTVEGSGRTQDLVLNFETQTFDGVLTLPSGTQTVVARAFSGADLVGVSTPTAVDVQPGVVTRLLLRIVDVSVETPTFGPIFDSLTFPTSAEVGAPITFALSVVAPAGDPVTYSWTSGCAAATFSAPDAATTSWSSSSVGSCQIDVVATSRGLSVHQSFFVVVFPAGSLDGGVSISGTFVRSPALELRLNTVHCDVLTGSSDSSCPDAIASPATTSFQLNVFGWGVSTPGTLEITDNCGGSFGVTFPSEDLIQGAWLPPAAGGVCIITGRAINGDGAIGTVTAAVLVHPGTQATSQTPSLNVSISTEFGSCFLFNNDPTAPLSCGGTEIGVSVFLNTNASYLDGNPGTLEVTDDCGGGHTVSSNPFNFGQLWTVTPSGGTSCTVTVRATSLQGAVGTATAIIPLF